MNCTFTSIGETSRGVIYRCVTCGATLPPLRQVPHRVFRHCSESGVEAPSIILRGEMFLTAAQKWQLAGAPERSDADVDTLSKCCQQCEQFRAGSCQLCGCRCMSAAEEKQDVVSIVLGKSLRNKIRMATEDCPWKCVECGYSRWQHVSGDGCQKFQGRT